MRLRHKATSFLLGMALCGCNLVDGLETGPSVIKLPDSAAGFQPARVVVGVGQTGRLRLIVRDNGFSWISLVPGGGHASISDISCQPAGACRGLPASPEASDSVSFGVFGVREVSMNVTGTVVGRQTIRAELSTPPGGCAPDGACYIVQDVNREAEVEVVP